MIGECDIQIVEQIPQPSTSKQVSMNSPLFRSPTSAENIGFSVCQCQCNTTQSKKRGPKRKPIETCGRSTQFVRAKAMRIKYK